MTKSKYLAIKPENKFNGDLVRDVCEELQSSRDCNLRDQDLLQSGTLRLWQRVQDRDFERSRPTPGLETRKRFYFAIFFCKFIKKSFAHPNFHFVKFRSFCQLS